MLQRRGEVVGLTGHGCHDSAAMAQANVAIATHGAHEAARCMKERVAGVETSLVPVTAASKWTIQHLNLLPLFVGSRRCSADLIVLEPGLGPILAAVMEARRVFKRLR